MWGVERSAQFWLRAYPPAWREQRGAEVAAVLLDLAPEGARRLDARTVLDLLRGGVVTRWRQTPPLRVYLPYRLFDLRVPAQYRDWVRQDIASPGSLRRNLVGRAWFLPLPLYNALAGDWRGHLPLWLAIGVATVATILCVRPESTVRVRLQHHARPARDEPRALGAFIWVRTSRARIAAEPGARVLVLLLAAGAVAWSAAAVVAPSRLGAVPCVAQGWWCVELVAERRESSALVSATLAVALLVGVALALVVTARVRRLLPTRPDQPARHLVALRPHAAVGLALWIGLLVTGALAEATGVWILSVSAIGAPVCLLLLPSAVVLWARATPDTAFVDLRHVAWTGAAIEVDRLDTDLVPAHHAEIR